MYNINKNKNLLGGRSYLISKPQITKPLYNGGIKDEV